MPGTIQVSVLELLDLPSSSISIKVSVGMKEHQVWDKGEFSFPLTTLRDNLIVALYDIEGNELSRTGMSTKIVVEKGIWEDLFPLEGGGQLHMKLQFILSEKERKRIRDMRETALKKKQKELLINGAKFPEMASVAKIAPSVVPTFNNEVTVSEDSGESDAQRDAENIEGRSLKGHAMLSPISPVNFGSEKKEEIWFVHTSSTNTGGGKRTPAEAGTSQDNKWVCLPETSQQIVKTTDNQSLPDGVPFELVSSERTSEYSEPRITNDADGTKGTFPVPMPSQEHKSSHLMEATRQIPVKINTQSPANDVTKLPSSSQNQTRITVKQVSLEKIPRTNETDREESSSEATQHISVKITTQSPPNSVTTKSKSLQNQYENTTKQTAPEITPRDYNETDRKETSLEATQQITVKVDTQPLPNDTATGPNTLHNQTHRSIKQISLEKNPGNTEAEGVEVSSEATRQVPMEIGTPAPPYYSTSSNSLIQTHSTIKQIPPVKIPRNNDIDREGESSVTQMSEEQKISYHTDTTPPLMEKTDFQPPSNVVPSKLISSKNDLKKSKFVPGEKFFSASRPLVENKTHGSENETPLTKTPMNVRKLISVLESSQPPGPQINAPKLKFQLSRVKSESSLKGAGANEIKNENSEANSQNLDKELIPISLMKPLEVSVRRSVSPLHKVKTEVPLEGPSISEVKKESTELKKQIIGALNPFSVGNTLKPTVHQNVKIVKSQKHVKPFEVLDEKPVATAGTNSMKQVDSNIQHKDETNSSHEKLLEDSSVTCEAETATISGRILDDPKFKEHVHTVQQSSRMLDEIPAAVEVINASEQVDHNIQHKEEHRNRQEALLDEFVVPPEDERTTTSGRLLEGPVRKVHTHGLHHERQGSFLNLLDEGVQRTNSDKLGEIGTSLDEQKSVKYLGVEQPYSEAMGSWILPDERSLCITSGSKQMMDFMGCFETNGPRNRRKNSLYCEADEKVALDNDTFVKEKETEMSSDNLRNSKLDRSEDDRVPGGLIGQAAKIVIAVAVGTLVVVLRGK